MTYFGPFAATLFVVGFILLLSRLARRGGIGRMGTDPSGTSLRVSARTGLGPRQGVAVVEAGESRFLVGYGEGGVRLLSPLPEVENEVPEGTDAPGGWDSESSPTPREAHILPFRPRDLQALLRRAFLVAALALVGAGWGGELRAEEVMTAFQEVPTVAPPASRATPLPGPTGTGEANLPLPSMQFLLGDEGEGERLRVTGPVGAVLVIGFLTLIPTLLLLMTSFTRILVVLHLLKQALGAQAAPPAHLLAAMALLLTGFVMAPTLAEVNQAALTPWMAGEMDEIEMMGTAAGPFRTFMMNATRDEDLALFLDLWGGDVDPTVEEIPFMVLTSAFVTSELRVAFQMGFALFLPFVVIDLVVASVLMSMGMFMLPPMMVSLPFKLLLFVLVDGWGLVVGGLIQSFR